jgi:hypothetical protein
MKTHNESGVTSPLSLKLGAKWRWEVKVSPRRLRHVERRNKQNWLNARILTAHYIYQNYSHIYSYIVMEHKIHKDDVYEQT